MPTVESYAPGVPCWIDLPSDDVEAAQAFYASLFGWEFEAMPSPAGMTYLMARLSGGYVAGLMAQSPQAAAGGLPSAWITYLAVPDAKAAETAIAANGGTVLFPTDEIPGAGRSVMGTDPQGAFIGFWEGQGHIGSSVVNEPGAVIWNELQVDDVPAVLPFYRAVAGLESRTEPAGALDEYTQFLAAGRSVAGASRNPLPEAPNGWSVCFNVADVNQTVARVQELGGSVVAPPFDIPGMGRMAVAADPAGARFSVMAGLTETQ